MEINFKNVTLFFETNEAVFSPKGLDLGTRSMLEIAEISDKSSILDLGCGYGFVGIFYSKFYPESKITMVDLSENAIDLSKINAQLNNVQPEIIQSNGFESIKEKKFDTIFSNPPYHVDFSVPKHFIENGYRQLNKNGKFYMVTKRRKWYENKIKSIFGYVKVTEVDDYYVFYAEKKEKPKKEKDKTQKLSKKLARKYKKIDNNRSNK